MTVKTINYRGRKGRVGAVCYTNDTLAFFAGYHDCQCGIRSKILLDIDEFRIASGQVRKDPLGLRFAKKLSRHYEQTQ